MSGTLSWIYEGIFQEYGVPGVVYNLWASKTFQLVSSILGTAFVLYKFYQTARFVWLFVRPSKLTTYCHSQTGSWALVTGASDGIGKAFSEELLSRGFNVLLHGRNKEKLGRLQEELQQRYRKRSVSIVVADASAYDSSYDAVLKKARSLPGKLTVLVNNVGGIHTYPQYVAHSDVPHGDIDNCINTNTRFPTHLTRAILPLLKENGPSIILNCGSSGGLVGCPYIVTYCATKAYIHTFTLALQNELVAEKVSNVEVMGFIIGNVTSAGNTYDLPGTITARQCAAGCLDKVGGGEALVWAHWKHALQSMALQALLPERYMKKFMAEELGRRVVREEKKD